jgi:predicted permease
MNDLRFGVRMLAKNPGFTLVAVALLAMGIGANAVIFSALDALVLRPLPVRHPEELVRMIQRRPQLGVRSNFDQHFYQALRERSTTITAVIGQVEVQTAMTLPAPPEQVRVHLVTPEFFDVLGVRPLYGRVLTSADGKDDAATPPAVLSYGIWRQRFEGDVHAVGRTIAIQGHTFTVVGVLPREFNGITTDTAPDIRVPLRLFPLLTRTHTKAELASLELAGRLKPGVSRAQSQAECNAIWRPVMEDYLKSLPPGLASPADFDELKDGMELESLEHGVSMLRQRFDVALELLAASTGLIQLMVCANLAGLLLARGAARRSEIAVRLALGATRSRLVRQMLVESALLTTLGAVGGLAVAAAATPLLVRALPPLRDLGTMRLTLTLEIGTDWKVLLFSLAVSALTALMFGLAPALSASRVSLDGVLRGARSAGGWRGRQALLVFQLGLCTMLLAGAGLLVRTFDQLQYMDPGFDREHLVAFTATPSISGYPEAQIHALEIALTARVRDLPGVESVGSASRGLMRGSGMKTTVALPGQKITRADFLNSSVNSVSPSYFETMGMRILEGRGFGDRDSMDGKTRHIVVNETFARHFFPGIDPIGRRLRGGDSELEVIGVVSDAKYRSLREPMTPTFYNPGMGPAGLGDDFVLYVRTRTKPEFIIQPVREALAAIDPALPFVEIRTLAEEVSASTSAERLTAVLASLFGLLAAVLAAVGIYGLFAYAVAQREREIGVRMALGAKPGDIGRMIALQVLSMLAGGVALGLTAAALASPVFRSILYGVQPLDFRSFAAAAAFVALVTALAAAVPGRRAIHVEPASALRQDN